MLDFKSVNHKKLMLSQALFAVLGYVFFVFFQKTKATHLQLGLNASELATSDLLVLSLLSLGFYACWGTVLSLAPIHFLKK